MHAKPRIGGHWKDIQYMEIVPELTPSNILLILNAIKSKILILLSVNPTFL